MGVDDRGSKREERFRSLYAGCAADVLAYALRRVGTPSDAADVVAEVFVVAWRRLDQVPGGAEARLWLFGVARRVVANQRRGERRRDRLGARLREHIAQAAPSPGAGGDDGLAPVRTALGRLDDLDRELLRLTVWEGLAPGEAAVALGMRAGTVRSRLHRARTRLRADLEDWPAALSAPLATEEEA